MLKDKPNTLVFSCRGDIRDFAVLATWLHEKGSPATSIAGLGRTIISLFADTIRNKHPEMGGTSTSDALKQLKILGLGTVGKRNITTLVNQLQLEDFEMEMGDPSFVPSLDDVSDAEDAMVSAARREAEQREQKKEMDRVAQHFDQGGSDGRKDSES